MIVGMCGRIGAGKETLTSFLREKGFVYFETSALLKEELAKRSLEITRWNMQNLADSMREKGGAGAVMKLLLDKASKDKTKNYIFDSLRNAGEAEFLKNNAKDFILIGVDAPQKMRFERMMKRAKPSDPKTWEEFLKVDERDNFDTTNPYGQQTGRLLEVSDFVIVNKGSLKDSLKEIEKIWGKISFKC